MTVSAEQAISQQNPFDLKIVFPLDSKQTLIADDYLDYLQRLEGLLTKRKATAETLVLKFTSKETLSALKTYLSEASELRFKELIIELDAEDQSLVELVKLAADKGLTTLNLSSTKLSPRSAAAILNLVQNSALCMDIILPSKDEFLETQQLLDDNISNFKRKRRIELFDKEAFETKKIKPQTQAKRKRNLPKTKKIESDTEVQVQVAVEQAHEHEKAIEEQFEDKTASGLISREEFIKLAKEDKFKTPLTDTDKKRISSTWDCWLGNIAQFVVKSKSNLEIKIVVGTKGGDENLCDAFLQAATGLDEHLFLIFLEQSSEKTLPTEVKIAHAYVSMHSGYQSRGYSHSPYLNYDADKSQYNELISQLLDEFYTGYPYPAKELSFNEWEKWKPLWFCNQIPTISEESWKGEYIVDATTQEAPEEATIESMLKTCPINFKTPQFVKRLFPNLKVPKLTKAAAEILLEYNNQLLFGLDFEHLPAGFEIKTFQEKGKQVYALDYSETKARLGTKDPFAIKLVKPEALPALSADEMQVWLKATTSQKLKKIYEDLLKPYNREKVRLFRQYLPALLYVPHDSLTSLEEAIKACSLLDLKAKTVKFKDHLLYQYLDDEGKKLVEAWDNSQKFSVADLNRILAVHTELGLKGLKRLDKVFSEAILLLPENKSDDSLLKELRAHYFPVCKTFLPCLDPNFAKALTIIKSFSESERYIWDNLFKQHCKAVGFDNLYNLVQTFQAFRKTIVETYKLPFPDKPKISEIKNLAISLSRIITILNATPSIDRAKVLETIFEMDWQSNATIKVLADAELKPEGGVLVLPEMQLKPINYANEHDYSSKPWHFDDQLLDHGYHALKITHRDPKSIVSDFLSITSFKDDGSTSNPLKLFGLCKDEAELKRNYYRLLASKPHRKSLDFYQKASKLIDKKFSNQTMRGVFYGLIAYATASFESSLKATTEAELLEQVQKTLCVFDKLHVPDLIKLDFINSVAGIFFPPPPLEYLVNIFSIIEQALNININELADPKKIIEKYSAIDIALCRIDASKHRCNKYAFYEGLRFFDLKAISLDDFCKLCHLSSQIARYSSLDNFSFVSLLSTFRLDETFSTKIYNLKLNHSSNLLANSLKILVYMKPGTPSPLNQEQLLEFISEVNKLHFEEDALDLVKQKFGKYFEPDFFDKLRSLGLSKELIALIQTSFPVEEEANLVKALLNSFTSIVDTPHREPVLKAIVKISLNLKDDDRKAFLEILATINSSKTESLENLANLLLLIGERRSVADFILIMRQKDKKPSIARLNLYYKEALPLIYLQSYGKLKVSEVQNLAIDLLEYLKKPEEFTDKFKDLLASFSNLSTRFPNEKALVLTILANFMDKKTDLDVSKFMSYLMMDNSQVLRSLCGYYAEKPVELYNLFAKLESLAPEKQAQILYMISALANNKKETTLAAVDEFIKLAEAKPELYEQTKACFQTPPYPEFTDLISWHKESKLEEKYLNFQKKPAEREKDNEFSKDIARPFADKFKGIDFEDKELEELEKAINQAKTLDIASLKAKLKTNIPHVTRLATLAELLYRSKAKKDNSFELNPVQYLTLLSYLKTGGHITAEMATGEGKSRTMMMALACQVSQGKTVDFVTSDMQLAARDYLEYQAFFKMIGAETSLIYANSAPSAYKIGGINFSDASNLSLFRNTARSEKPNLKNPPSLVIDPNPKNRVLILDEADKTYFDISETRFNYSALPKSAQDKDMTWVYPLLIKFFTQDKAKAKIVLDLYKNDIDACNDAFFDFVKAQDGVTDEMLAFLAELPENQIETWHDSALTAINLKLGEDYTIEPNVVIETTKGPKLASEARLIYGSRIAQNSKFSFGVHQCLHAYLNQELAKVNSATSIKCKEVMKNQAKPGEALPFHIEAEKQIIYSSTSKSLLDEYKDGEIWGITGTLGAIIEREEAALLYSMKFLTAPRIKEPRRDDRPLRLTKDFESRMEAILEYILEAHDAGRPVLLIAETDSEAQKIKEALQALAGNAIAENNWRFVDSLTSAKEEASIIAEAGKQGITISTKRLGRGTDIELGDKAIKDSAKKIDEAGGLRVIATFLPRDRDLNQIFGRAGRYGAKGDARLVVDKAQLKKSKVLRAGLFLSTEYFIKSKQAEGDKRQQVERLLRQVLSDFRVKITDSFFKYYDTTTATEGLEYWSTCTKDIDQLWAKAQIDLQELVASPKIDIKKINTRLEEFKADSQKCWAILNGKLGNVLKDIDKIELSPITSHLIKAITPKRLYTVEDRVQLYKAYDKALDGRAVIYDTLFMEYKNWRKGKRELFANTKAALRGTGIIFADSLAILTGKRPLFANLRAWMTKPKQELQVKCKTILQALETHNRAALRRLLRTEDARTLVSGNMLSLKIELVEVILSYLHKKTRVSDKEMDAFKKILDGINQSTNLEDVKKLPMKGRFFSYAVKREIREIISERKDFGV